MRDSFREGNLKELKESDYKKKQTKTNRTLERGFIKSPGPGYCYPVGGQPPSGKQNTDPDLLF